MYSDPTLLTAAVPGTAPATVSIRGDQLIVSPAAGFLGTIGVVATVTNGLATASQAFRATVVAPTLAPVADQRFSNQTSDTIALTSSDATGASPTYSAVAEPLPFWLQQTFGLYKDPAGYNTNGRGGNEKYLRGKVSANGYSTLGQDPWYYLLPNGDLFELTPPYSSTLAGALVARLGTTNYTDPTLLTAAADTSIPVTFSISNNALTVSPGAGYSGTFEAIASVNDGIDTATQPIRVSAVQPATPSITWATPADIQFGTKLSSAQLDATASVPGTFVYSPALGAVLRPGRHESLSVTFTPTDSTDYATASGSVDINVLGAAAGDFTGIGSTDLAIYSSKYGVLGYLPTNGTAGNIIQYGPGGAGAIPAPGDYFGDGKADLAIYVPQYGIFAVKEPGGSGFIKSIGPSNGAGFVPAPGDYDGSGKTEMAIYSSVLGEFIYQPAAGGPAVTVKFGPAGEGFEPAPGDYDGDGKTDFALYSPQYGLFAIKYSSGIPSVISPFGPASSGFEPAPGDYDGDGKTDIAVYSSQYGVLGYKPSDGSAGVIESFGPAGAGAEVVPGDYDGDGKTDLAVYVPRYAVFGYKPSNGSPGVIQSFGPPNAGFVGYLAPPVSTVLVASSSVSGGGSGDLKATTRVSAARHSVPFLRVPSIAGPARFAFPSDLKRVEAFRAEPAAATVHRVARRVVPKRELYTSWAAHPGSAPV